MKNNRHRSALTFACRLIAAFVALLVAVGVSADEAISTDGVPAAQAQTASAGESAQHIAQQLIVEVEVDVGDATQAALLRSRGYDCAVGTCRLELPDGEELRLSEFGLSLRITARAIKVSGDARHLASSATAADESYVWGSNDNAVSWNTIGVCTAIDTGSAPTAAKITRNVVTALVSCGRVSDLHIYLWDPPDISSFWNHQGGYTDQGLDNDREDDSDVDLRGRETTFFAGRSPNKHWYLCAADDVDGYGGTLQRWSMYVYFCYCPLVPWSTSPANGATNVSLDRDLDWSADPLAQSWDVYFGTTNPPPYREWVTSNTYVLPTLECATHYYWKVVGHNDCGITDGPVWDFTTIGFPAQPSSPSPANHATGVLLDADLVWAPCSTATSYTVRWGTTNPPKNSATTSINSLALAPLNPNTHYYWYVVASNGGCSSTGSTWDFTTGCIPAVPRLPQPPDSSAGVALDADLDWADSPGAGSYDVYFGTCSPRPPPLVGSTTSSSYALTTLSPATSYCWRIVAKGVCGETSGPDWDFTTVNPMPTPTLTKTPTGTQPPSPTATPTRTTTCTATRTATVTATRTRTPTHTGVATPTHTLVPGQPTPTCAPPAAPRDPFPAHGAEDVPCGENLDWADVEGATLYRVYLGTSATPPYHGVTTGSDYALTNLSCDTHYYWQVVAESDCGSQAGPVWEFSTLPCNWILLPLLMR